MLKAMYFLQLSLEDFHKIFVYFLRLLYMERERKK
jgi:hypothetical protein